MDKVIPSLQGVVLALASLTVTSSVAAQTVLHPQTMPRIADVDPRYVSFNVEAVEVTGGRFWKPFPHGGDATPAPVTSLPAPGAAASSGDPYQYRPPIDLTNPKLRKLASALAPSYMRVSGTWRNSTYFQNDDAAALATPPAGFKNVMTRAEWKNAVDFSHAVGADLVTSVAISDGTRDAQGLWTPAQAKAFFDYTASIGGHIAATEFFNEPTFASMGAAPKGYDAAAFGRDVQAFSKFLRAESPSTIYLGPGSVGEGVPLLEPSATTGSAKPAMPLPALLPSEDLLKATGPAFDAFSYHFYTTLSSRCVGNMGLGPDKVLTAAYLDRNPNGEAFYAKLRDKYQPSKPIWLTETGEAACGGDRWASSFVDTFRFADQLGVLAQKNVQTIMVNTLASSDYGLLDETTLTPRPDYWIALLWKRLMGTRVLDPEVKPTAKLRVYAQCMKDSIGGVTLIALNMDQDSAQSLTLPVDGDRYTLTAADLLSKTALLNGAALKAEEDGASPATSGMSFKADKPLGLPPASITFVTMPDAKNPACLHE